MNTASSQVAAGPVRVARRLLTEYIVSVGAFHAHANIIKAEDALKLTLSEIDVDNSIDTADSTNTNTPEGYKLLSMGRHLQRRADELDHIAEKMEGKKNMAARTMTMVEAQNSREVGNWLVEKGEWGIKS